MAPEVEQVRPMDLLPGVSYFTLNLGSDAPFDGATFDAAITEVVGGPDRKGTQLVKFMVYGESMVIFPSWLSFIEADDFMVRNRSAREKLNCVGDMRLKGGKRKIQKLPGNGMEDFGLSSQESDRYRDTVLAQKLGEHFVIE